MNSENPVNRARLFGLLSALLGGAALLRWIAARSNTQVHRINQHRTDQR